MSSREQLSGAASLAAAYARCEQLARDHHENFPVASRLLPKAMRPHIAALYAFARIADDFADEGERPAEERQRLLGGWLDRLHEATGDPGSQAGGGNDGTEGEETRLLFLALSNTIRERRLPVALFEDLISAFRQDTWKTRYDTHAELLDYCRRSANPVGRLVLRVAGYDSARLDAASDCICSALQLANFWQDLERDWRRGRLYVPLADVRSAGADLSDLDKGRLTPAWRAVLATLVGRTRAMFEQGRLIADEVRGRLRLELRLTWLGGMRILERIERQQFDVYGRRPALGGGDLPLLLWRAATWRASRRGTDRSPIDYASAP